MRQMLLEQIRTVFNSRGLPGAKIVAGGKPFHVAVDTKAGRQVCSGPALRQQDALFSDPSTAIKLLYEIGFRLVTVDMSGWNAGSPN